MFLSPLVRREAVRRPVRSVIEKGEAGGGDGTREGGRPG